MNVDHEVAKGGAELTYKQYVTLLLSTASTFDTEKAPKSRRDLKEDLQANIFYMEGYLQEECIEYLNDRHVYEMVGDDNREWNIEHDHQQVYNVGINYDSHVNNTSVFIIRTENSRQRFFPCQT